MIRLITISLMMLFLFSFQAYTQNNNEVCTSNSDCNDFRFCNGVEICSPNSQYANSRGCVAGSLPCSEFADNCDEENDVCITGCVHNSDNDDDGHVSMDCGGDDCDDSDANRYPGNPEVCDSEGIDEDCDPNTIGNRDSDGDGYIDHTCFFLNK